MKVLLGYLRLNWLIYCLLFVYVLALTLNAMGLHIWLPACQVTYFTGHECFGCGLNRAAIALLSGDVRAAINYNPLIFIYLPLVCGWIIYDFTNFSLKTNQTSYEKH